MLGNFDGFHLGHNELLNELKKINIKKGLLTFYPHPLKILTNLDFKYLDTIEDKEKKLENDLDYLIVINTTIDILKKDKNSFINFLKNNNVSDIVCGNDFTFGKNKSGTIKDLSEFNLHIVPDFKIDNIRVSSTYIRKYLNEGNIDLANKYLGHYYEIEGCVSHGSHLGNTIGFPTANIEENEYLLPNNGVYFGYAIIDKKKVFGMINIGINPTINLLNKKRLEINLFDFKLDIYNKNIRVGFIKKLRDEIKFNSKEDLINMLNKNKLECLNLINEYQETN
jgi:riboflavin kinase/FMN adenylyltransferase